MAERIAEDDRAQANARHESREGAEGAQSLEIRALARRTNGGEVIGQAGDIPPGRLDVAPQVKQVRPGPVLECGEDSEVHCVPP